MQNDNEIVLNGITYIRKDNETNTGNWNTGNWNTGDMNTGDWN